MKAQSHSSWTISLLTLILLLLFASNSWGYTPPKGIPNPSASFSTFGEIDQATPVWPAEWSGESKSEVANKYYIDKTEAGCSNARTYGYPGYARCLPPEGSLASGAYVYIHAGTYTAAENSEDRWQWHGNGTASNPIWITGNPVTKPIFSDKVTIGFGGNASYIIFENFEVSSVGGLLVLPYGNYAIDHIIIRNNKVYGTGTNSDENGILVGSGGGTDTYSTSTIAYVVIYNNEVYNIGTSTGQATAGDQAGIYGSYHTSYLWVLNNNIYSVSSDGVAGCHYCNAYDSGKYLNNYYIGGNTITNTGEDCVDLKSVRYVIISENECYDTSGEGYGAGVVLHYGENGAVGVVDAYVLFNKISGQNTGMAVTLGQDIHMVGNIIYDVTDLNPDTDILDGTCFGFRGTTGSFYVVDNTCYNYVTGLAVQQGSLGSGDSMKIHGNIFSTRNDTSGYEINIGSGDQDYVDMDYNRFFASIEANNFSWAGSDHSLAEIQGHSECEHCTAGDPSFKSTIASSADFLKLNTGSECIGANVEGPVGATVYDAFYTAYSLSIEKDYVGTARPQQTTWDIGAYEYNPSTAKPSMSIGSGAAMSIGSGATATLY